MNPLATGSLQCGTLQFDEQDGYSSSSAGKFGALRAEYQLLSAALKIGPEVTWTMWHSGLVPPPTVSISARSRLPKVAGLKKRFGSQFDLFPLSRLQVEAGKHPSVFLSGLSQVAAISTLRRTIAGIRLPICGLTHSLFTRDMVGTYTSLILEMEPYDVLVATSSAAQDALERMLLSASERLMVRCGPGSSPAPLPRIVHLPLGVDLPEDELTQKQARSLLDLPQERFTLLYVGRLSEEYKADLDAMFLIVSELVARGVDVQLILAGQLTDQVYGGHLHRFRERAGLEERVTLLENFPDVLKSALYASCDLAVAPSDSLQESFGLSILEAMAHGRPVVATDWSGHRDLVRNGKTGFLVKTLCYWDHIKRVSGLIGLADPHALAHSIAQATHFDVREWIERCEHLHRDPELRRAMGQEARFVAAQQYAWPLIAARFLELWQSQIEEASRFASRSTPGLDLSKVFQSYPSTELGPKDRVRLAERTDAANDPALPWEFRSANDFQEVSALLKLLRQDEYRIADLIEMGFEERYLLWLAKKGLIEVTPPETAR